MTRSSLLVLPLLLFSVSAKFDHFLLRNLPASHPVKDDSLVGEASFLSSMISEDNTADEARVKEASLVDLKSLPGLKDTESRESYSGFITVNKKLDSNMFFWFFPAENDLSNKNDLPVVVWLQGGPGSSSLFGLFEVNGPIEAVFKSEAEVEARLREHHWAKNAHMLYIDNPVGAGFSFGPKDDLPTNQAEAADHMYEFLRQWFILYSSYQNNPFHIFGESFAGRWVPTFARRIDEMNQDVPDNSHPIKLSGIGVGNGFFSPVDTAVYADLYYSVGMIDEDFHENVKGLERRIKEQAELGLWSMATNMWSKVFDEITSKVECDFVYKLDQCHNDPELDNYGDFVQMDSVRQAIHVGSRPFGQQSADVFEAMSEDFMKSSQEDIEYLLDRYPFLMFNGNLDIICNHNGILNMFAKMETWSDIGLYRDTPTEVYHAGPLKDTAGYLKTAGNLRLLSIRNAGHFAARHQPEVTLQIFEEFISGQM